MNKNETIAKKQELNENSKSAQIELCNLAKLRKAASNALAELKLFRKIHDARLHFCDIVHVGNAKLYLHDALALFTDSPENENSGADNVTAGKQEMPGDAAKLREALVNISRYADCAAMRPNDAQTQEYIEQIRKWAEAALAEPPRECDVGTAEEQEARYKNNCGKGIPNCTECKTFAFKKERHMKCDCKFVWAQMPYNESEAPK